MQAKAQHLFPGRCAFCVIRAYNKRMRKRASKGTASLLRSKIYYIPFVLLTAIIGVVLIMVSRAAPSVANIEPENSTRTGVTTLNDTTASGGRAIAFGSGGSSSHTGGSGGAKTDRLSQTFTAGGITSNYHIFAANLDWTKNVGMLLWTDGSGGYGIDNPNSTYLLDADGASGMVAVARSNNMILLVPEAPAPGCDGYDNCWYNETTTPNAVTKAQWARSLVDYVYGQYDIYKDRVAIGGYSSGAQFTSRWFVPLHGPAIQTDGVFVPVAYGGAPASGNTFTQAYKAAVVGYWNTGTADEAYSTANWGAIGGYNWYTSNGFTTKADWPAGVGHARDGQFDSIMAAQIAAYVRAP